MFNYIIIIPILYISPFRSNMAHPIVFFDLKTTGLIRDNGEDIPNIIQIGAVDSFGEKDPFMIHLVPGRAFEDKATEVTGYSTDETFQHLFHRLEYMFFLF